MKLPIKAIMIEEEEPSLVGVKMSESINRAFMYGESVFSTMRVINGHVFDWDYHFDRLRKSVEFVYGPFVDGEDWVHAFKSKLEDRILLDSGLDRVVRLTIYREQARGLRAGIVHISDLKIHVSTSPFDPVQLDHSIKLRTCAAPQRPSWWPSYLKSGDYLATILSQKMFLKPGDDDLLFLSPDDTILESSVANIFVVRHNKLYTPPLGPNVLDGVMRKRVIEVALDFFDDVRESETSFDQLLKADACFATNSVRGPFLVGQVDDHEFTYTQEFMSQFESLRKRVFG